MDIRKFLSEHGLPAEKIETHFGYPGLANSLTAGLFALEDRLYGVESRIELVNQMLMQAQPQGIGSIKVAWVRHRVIYRRPRPMQWRRNAKTGKWIAYKVRGGCLHKYVRKSDRFRSSRDIVKVLVSLLAELLRTRTQLLQKISALQSRLWTPKEDPFAEIDQVFFKIAQNLVQLKQQELGI